MPLRIATLAQSVESLLPALTLVHGPLINQKPTFIDNCINISNKVADIILSEGWNIKAINGWASEEICNFNYKLKINTSKNDTWI